MKNFKNPNLDNTGTFLRKFPFTISNLIYKKTQDASEKIKDFHVLRSWMFPLNGYRILQEL
jgi:hypothetical protein